MRNKQPTRCIVPLQKLRARLGTLNRFKPPPPSNSLLTVLLPGFGVRVSMTFHLMFVHIFLVRVRFGSLSGHLLGKSCPFGWPYVLFVF